MDPILPHITHKLVADVKWNLAAGRRSPSAFVGLAELCVGQAGRIQDIHMHVIVFTSHIHFLVIDRDLDENENDRNQFCQNDRKIPKISKSEIVIK